MPAARLNAHKVTSGQSALLRGQSVLMLNLEVDILCRVGIVNSKSKSIVSTFQTSIRRNRDKNDKGISQANASVGRSFDTCELLHITFWNMLKVSHWSVNYLAGLSNQARLRATRITYACTIHRGEPRLQWTSDPTLVSSCERSIVHQNSLSSIPMNPVSVT